MPDSRHTLAANALRALAIDAVNQANSGHPGAPMGLADVAVVLFTKIMRFDPACPSWPNRDRFVLSNGHASMLLYGALHLAGYELSMDELRRFRQLGSKTPGHPEYGHAPGVETTTGPLGQGFANAVGMALAGRMARARFGERVDHMVYGICGDGCLMEGISAEAASLAGHLGLGELVFVYDDNGITIDGGTEIAFTEDVQRRFESYGWRVLRCNGHDPAAIEAALHAGIAERDRPTLIMAKTRIGYGSPKFEGTSKVHGAPLGPEEGAAAKAKLGWTHPPFVVPDEARAPFVEAARRGAAARIEWETAQAAWREQNPAAAAAWDAAHRPADLEALTKLAIESVASAKKSATRALSATVLNALAGAMPSLVGGSADLAESNKTHIKGSPDVSRATFAGRNVNFGVREHAMGAIVNGMALYGGFVPFGATFLTFSDYMRPALRLAALMQIRALTVFTHDSLYLGEDGPTHQAVEHAWALRLIPGLHVWRPADALETAVAWAYAVAGGTPAPHALLFTRQNVAILERAAGFEAATVARGGYVLAEGKDLSIVATGSEVEVAVEARKLLAASGVSAAVVSMPCVERFLAQPADYRAAVLPPGRRTVTIELGRTTPWASIAPGCLAIGVDTFGASAPAEVLAEEFGMSVDKVTARIRAWLGEG